MAKNFVNIKELKTYTKSFNKGKAAIKNSEIKNNIRNTKVPLSTQNAVKYLLDGTLRLRVCRYCLSVTSGLSELDEILVLAVNDSLHEVTIRDMVASFHPYKVTEDCHFPNKICSDCLTHTIGCYLFAQQCERSERALRNCFDDMYEKLEKLDPLEPVKKRGKRKTNLNHNILYTEHEDVINYAEPIINLINVDMIPPSNDIISDLECQKCAQVLPSTESLLNHEKSHPKSMWFNCRLCGKSFVKQFHLRKHLKEHYIPDEEIDKNITNEPFKCSTCGDSNKTVVDHLQHIEKHKFKETFQSIIERRTDNICSVCINKGSRMVDLSEVIHLHGGYPELTGDKTIQSILRTSIPEKTCKYRKLIHPKRTTILRLTNKYSQIKQNYSITRDVNDKSFLFSLPKITDSDAIEYKDLKRPESIKQIELTFPPNISDSEHVAKIDLQKLKFNADEIIDEYAKDKIRSCKVCWIFNKATCNTCLEASRAKEMILPKNRYKVMAECSLCWIFKKAGKCNFCNRIVSTSDVAKDLDDKESETNRQATEIQKQENLWQCNLCLITLDTYTGTKICDSCLNHAITSHVFIVKVKYIRNRLNTCVSLMLNNLDNIDPKNNIMVEISQQTILPSFKVEDDVIESDDSKTNIEVLEDEFRISSESESDFDELKQSDNNELLENPAKNVTKTYVNKKLVNGYQNKYENENVFDDICSEFLTFKKKKSPRKYTVRYKYTCPFCNKYFISDYFLKKHILKHVHKTVQCDLCPKKFKSNFYLFEHKKMAHVQKHENFISCKICGRTFLSINKIKSHQKCHKIKQCQLCDKNFKSQKYYDIHMQRHAVKFNMHENRNVQTCSFCEKACPNENELSLHVNKIHLQIKPYSCDMCDKQFYTEYNLISHKKLHSLFSKESCIFCNKVLKCRKDLVVHVRKHIGSKPHQCPVCRKSFYSDSKMKKHMVVLHGGKYCCRLCRTVLPSQIDLKTHINVVHSTM